MVRLKNFNYQAPNFLKSEHVVPFTYEVDDTHPQAEGGVVPAGAIYPGNSAGAIGIVYNDVDVSDGPQPVSVIVEGHIYANKLPEAPDQAALDAMKQINFYDADNQPFSAGSEGA